MTRDRTIADSGRLLSLDAMRGLAVAGMILVNNPGDPMSVWPPLAHASWNGCRAADLVFPTFLFIVGVAITLSLAPRLRDGMPRGRMARRIVRRSATLVLLGLLLNALPYFDLVHLRVPGILQRIGLCYLLASLAFLVTDVPGQAILTLAILVAHWLVLMRVPVPGLGPGVLEPDANIGAWLDRQLLAGHLGRGSWDPEGILGTFPALATVLMGVLAGHWIRSAPSARARIGGLVIVGGIAAMAGEAMAAWLPVNKQLWTSSFALLTGGLAAVLLAACHWLVDVRRNRTLAMPFVVFGSNPILVYVLATMVAKVLDATTIDTPGGLPFSVHDVLYQRLFAGWAGPTGGSALFAFGLVAIWLVPMAILYRRGLFFKV